MARGRVELPAPRFSDAEGYLGRTRLIWRKSGVPATCDVLSSVILGGVARHPSDTLAWAPMARSAGGCEIRLISSERRLAASLACLRRPQSANRAARRMAGRSVVSWSGVRRSSW